MKRGSACGGVAGGNAVARDFWWPWHGSTGADREQFSLKERERIGDCLSEENAAGKNGVREINAALILECVFSGIYSPDRRLGKVKDEKTGENLLKDEVQLLRMKMDEANGVFQVAEGTLDFPTHGIETFQGSGRKLLRLQVGNEKLGITVFCFNTNDPERKGRKASTSRL